MPVHSFDSLNTEFKGGICSYTKVDYTKADYTKAVNSIIGNRRLPVIILP